MRRMGSGKSCPFTLKSNGDARRNRRILVCVKVPNIACPEMTVPIPSAMAIQQSSSMQVHQSVAGGLVTSAAASIASIWRGWTNK